MIDKDKERFIKAIEVMHKKAREKEKEKAIELVNKYLRTYPIYDNPTVVISYTYNEAKQCALISVNEIIKALRRGLPEVGLGKGFWYNVREEIEKL